MRTPRASRKRGVASVAALLCLLTFASGCPVGPNYVRPKSDPPPDYYGQTQPVEI